MKKIIALVLAMVMVMGVFAGCQTGGEPETTAATVPTQTPEEEAVLRVLAIGNSHTNDCTQLLYYVFNKEMPEQKVLIANMYYSGCSLAQHVDFETGDKPVYVYYKNDIEKEYAPVERDTEVFNRYARYEPNYTQVVYLRVENNGDIPFQFKFSVDLIGSVDCVNVYGASASAQVSALRCGVR